MRLSTRMAVIASSVNQSRPPILAIVPEQSSILFNLDSSIPMEGYFDKWEARIKFKSADVLSALLAIKVQAATLHKGTGMNVKEFLDFKGHPTITFLSKQLVRTSPDTFDVHGTFTMCGVYKVEKLTLLVSEQGTGLVQISGTMAFDRRDRGINGSIPFTRKTDRVEIIVDLIAKRISGCRMDLKH
jgi:polyisoprenoid-binding protein YceI